jgi:hypothetical protein
MSKELSMFSGLGNAVAGYSRFRHVRTYVAQCSTRHAGKEASKRLMARVGYARYEKFIRRRAAWDALARPVPLAYLEAIGVDTDVMSVAGGADMEAYREALAIPRFPRWAIVRYMPAIYGRVWLPPGATEQEAVRFLLGYSSRTGWQCCLSYPDLKAIYIRPDGDVSITHFPPVLLIQGGFLTTGMDGRDIGACRIGRGKTSYGQGG